MPTIFEDPRFLAPAATTAGIFVSIFLWWLNQRKKALSYQILSAVPLVNFVGNAGGSLDVRFDGQPVEDAYLVVVKIFNSGHLPISAGDYEAALAICLSGGVDILRAEVLETHPANLRERVRNDFGERPLIERIENNKITIAPVLLNANDSITIQVLVSHLVGGITLSGHIGGVRTMKECRESNGLARLLKFGGALIFLAGVMLVPVPALMKLELEEILPYLLTALIGAVVFTSGVALYSRSRTQTGLHPDVIA